MVDIEKEYKLQLDKLRIFQGFIIMINFKVGSWQIIPSSYFISHKRTNIQLLLSTHIY